MILALDGMVSVKAIDFMTKRNQPVPAMWIEKKLNKIAKAGTYASNEKI